MDFKIEPKHPLVRYRKYLIPALILLAIIVYTAFFGPQKGRLKYEKANLQIAEVSNAVFRDYLEIEGTAQPRQIIQLNSLEDGIVDRITAIEGNMLKLGDTILCLKNPGLLEVIEDERDDYENARLSYEEKMLQMKHSTSELKRSVLKTRYDLERISKQFTLDNEEYKLGVKSPAQLSLAKDEYAFNRNNTLLMLEELKHDSLMNIVQARLMKDELARGEKKFKRAKDRLEGLIVRSPAIGQLSLISVVPGQKVTAGNSIGELKIIDKLKITAKIEEYYIERIYPGLPAFILYENKKYLLHIAHINPEIKDREFEADFVFDDEAPENIRVGKGYRLQLELGQPKRALVVDKGNFYQSTGGQWVFKLDPGSKTARKAAIRVGRQNPRQYEIESGLKSGDRIIISGYENFGDARELILE